MFPIINLSIWNDEHRLQSQSDTKKHFLNTETLQVLF